MQTYWDITSSSEQCNGCSSYEIDVYGGSGSSMETLGRMMAEANRGETDFDWTRFYPVDPKGVKLIESQGDNPYPVTGGSSCTWGCQGWACSASQPCQGENECVSGVCKACSWDCLGWQCSSSSPCKDVNQCSSGVCQKCDWGCPVSRVYEFASTIYVPG